MTAIDTTKGLSARLGGWSARHKKSVLAGWFVFVALAMIFAASGLTSLVSTLLIRTCAFTPAEQLLLRLGSESR